MNSVSLIEAHLERTRHEPGPSPERDEQLRQQLNALRQVLSQCPTITQYNLTLPYFFAGQRVLSKLPATVVIATQLALTDHAPLIEAARKYLTHLLAG